MKKKINSGGGVFDNLQLLPAYFDSTMKPSTDPNINSPQHRITDDVTFINICGDEDKIKKNYIADMISTP